MDPDVFLAEEEDVGDVGDASCNPFGSDAALLRGIFILEWVDLPFCLVGERFLALSLIFICCSSFSLWLSLLLSSSYSLSNPTMIEGNG